MAVGDAVPYGIKVAPVSGGITKNVVAVWVAPTTGPITKKVVGVRVAPSSGGITKKVYIGGGIYGDVNGDGVVDIVDYTMVRQYILGLRSFTPEEFYKADVNKDGVVNQADLDLIQAYIQAHM